MSRERRYAQTTGSQSVLTPHHRKASRVLRKAWLAARAEQVDAWQYAVEIDELSASGRSHTDLRSLLKLRCAEHAQERTKAGSRRRTFRRLDALDLPKRTCLVLTAKGFEVTSEKRSKRVNKDDALAIVPRWDKETRQLWWQDILVKEFHGPAPNQELVLEAFQEQKWPARMDDPLPQSPRIDPKVRLHDKIKMLNRHHRHRVLRFGGDGSGQGVRWFVVMRG
jgi:hypothetical protein